MSLGSASTRRRWCKFCRVLLGKRNGVGRKNLFCSPKHQRDYHVVKRERRMNRDPKRFVDTLIREKLDEKPLFISPNRFGSDSVSFTRLVPPSGRLNVGRSDNSFLKSLGLKRGDFIRVSIKVLVRVREKEVG